MTSLVFSLRSTEDAQVASHELRRNGVAPQQFRIIDRLTAAHAAKDPILFDEFSREVANGRVLLEVHVNEQNQAAVERLIHLLGTDARKFLLGETSAVDAEPV